MPWIRISFDHGKTHAVHSTLAPALIADMLARDMPIKNYEREYGKAHAEALGGNPREIAEWSWDQGGSCYQHEPRGEIVVDGLAIDVPCFHWVWVLADLCRIKRRTFATGEQYYKLHHWHHATVLTPAQVDAAIDELGRGKVAAHARCVKFNEEQERRRAEREVARCAQ